MNKRFENFYTGLTILKKYDIIGFSIDPINQVSPFSHEPEFTSRATVTITIFWANADTKFITNKDSEQLKELGWRVEEGMGEDYWIFGD